MAKDWMRSLLTGTLLSGVLLVGCGAAPLTGGNEAMTEAAPSAPVASSESYQADAAAPAATAIATVPQALPQLIKRASLSITVEDIAAKLSETTAIAQRYQGDILSLNSSTPADDSEPQSAYLEIRVPQARLEQAIADLSALGEVKQQTITAEDVSSQLVDYEARLRNLRKSEEMVLGIMERSGDMAEVLQVARELDTIRATIEQIDAQLTSLRNQVSFSTISLTLQTEGAIAPSKPNAGTQISRTWQQATVSMGDLTTDLVQLLVWILVYSPYLLAIGGLTVLSYKVLKRRPPQPSQPSTPNESAS